MLQQPRQPTLGYHILSCCALSSGVLLFLLSVAAMVTGIVFLSIDLHQYGSVATPLLVAGVVGLFFCIVSAGRATRVRLLVLRLCGGYEPTTRKELFRAVHNSFQGTGRPFPTIIGSGWGFWTAHAVARGRCIFVHKLSGIDKEFDQNSPEEVRLLAGTTIKRAVWIISNKYGKTFWSTPSIQDISLGGWFGCSCHGNSGAGGKPSSFAVKEIECYDMHEWAQSALSSPKPLNLTYMKARQLFDTNGVSRYLIVSILFDVTGVDAAGTPRMLADTTTVQKQLYVIPTSAPAGTTHSQELYDWLDDDAPLRVFFLGSARKRYSLGLVYRFFDESTAKKEDLPMHTQLCCIRRVHHDPHDCSAACMSGQLDGCSALWPGWFEGDPEAYRGLMKMPDANAFTPGYGALLVGPALIHLAGFRNCEFIFKLVDSVNPNTKPVDQVQKLIEVLYKHFQLYWGRAELRTNTKRDAAGFVFVDIAGSDAACESVVHLLKPFISKCRVALHTGKYQSPRLIRSIETVASLQRVTPYEIFSDTGLECV